MFRTTCPRCGSKTLEVTYGRFIADGLQVLENGVDFRKAKDVSLDEEEPAEVICRTCGSEFALSDLREVKRRC